MTVPAIHDPRPPFARSLDQTEYQIAAMRPGEPRKSTPCADYDVRALLGHVVAVLHKTPASVPESARATSQP
ncbi:maleylpyruvate isomerase N-terminal domain-containing protein [Amycolatopsis sp. CA-230715]|uniref:maleylpyruvate isomerase N-terminal domain-containing protein n=1 Tax=Amycolatopsis sp. CA-230715 TaxID=2745196 RepID=UPI001C0289A2|nr:maleylpyruvate isomerase N-terminal domain-containing protein [Amycolatopsis sp. CA-230715]QWF84693.1 hypothetical protein HUW46_08145 [Amycolatopsis sp. CA-230715]